MKNTFAAARVAALILGLFVSSASAGDPIPGVDVELGKNPGGSIVAKATTGKDGKFVFDHLVAGKYLLSTSVRQTKAPISTSRSNIRHPSIVANGIQVVTATVTLGSDPASAEIEVTAAKGKITGTVIRADAPTKVSTPVKATKATGVK